MNAGFRCAGDAVRVNVGVNSGSGRAGFGRPSFGQSSFGRSSFGQSSFGRSSFGQSAFGRSSFGQSAFGRSSFGQSSFGRSSFGQGGFRAPSFGGGSYGRADVNVNVSVGGFPQGGSRGPQGWGQGGGAWDCAPQGGSRGPQGWGQGGAWGQVQQGGPRGPQGWGQGGPWGPIQQGGPRPPQGWGQGGFGGPDLGWSVSDVKDGKATIDLGERYQLSLNEKSSEWNLLDRQNDSKIRVWGDPHVDIDGDGRKDFDFKNDATFQLEDGTKIKVGTVPFGDRGNTMSSKLSIVNGHNAIQVTGLGDKHDGANNLQIQQSRDGYMLDRATPDGTFVAQQAGREWSIGGQKITQDLVSRLEGR